MTDAPACLSWRDVELGAPELAQLGIARLTFNRGLMKIHRWSPRSGYSVATRPYP